MKRKLLPIVLTLLAGCLLSAFAFSVFAQSGSNSTAKQTGAITDKGWPRTFASGAISLSVYQPQIEQWKETRLEARAAVAVTNGQSRQPVYGVIWLAARTEIDKVNRLVRMTD